MAVHIIRFCPFFLTFTFKYYCKEILVRSNVLVYDVAQHTLLCEHRTLSLRMFSHLLSKKTFIAVGTFLGGQTGCSNNNIKLTVKHHLNIQADESFCTTMHESKRASVKKRTKPDENVYCLQKL